MAAARPLWDDIKLCYRRRRKNDAEMRLPRKRYNAHYSPVKLHVIGQFDYQRDFTSI